MSADRPEQAAPATPGQALYEGVFAQALIDGHGAGQYAAYEELEPWQHARWEAGAQAAIGAAAAQPGGLDSLYRERAHLVAHLAAIYPSCIGPAPDADGWAIVCIAAPEQMTWHISYRDLDLFGHVHVGTDEWDGHTTAEKYARLDKLTARRAGPAAVTAGTEHLAGQLRDLAGRDGRP